MLRYGHPAIVAFTRRDLLDDRSVRVSDLWALPEACRVLARQRPDGRWRYPNPKPEIRPVDGCDQLETYRQRQRPLGGPRHLPIAPLGRSCARNRAVCTPKRLATPPRRIHSVFAGA